MAEKERRWDGRRAITDPRADLAVCAELSDPHDFREELAMEDPQQSGAHDAQESIDALVASLGSRDDASRQAARSSLVARGEAAVPALAGALQDRAWLVRWEAAKALSAMRAPSSAPALARALEDSRFGVRWLAAEGLINLGAAGVRPLINTLIANLDSTWLREGSHHVLKVLAERGLADVVGPMVSALEAIEPGAELIVRAHSALDALSRHERKKHGLDAPERGAAR